MKSRRLFARAVFLITIVCLSGCDAAQVMQVVPGISPTDAASVAAHVNQPQTCATAMDTYWPTGSRSSAKVAMGIESGGSATAMNHTVVRVHGIPNHAYSCMQLLLPLHADLYRAEGCDPVTQRFDPACAMRAAVRLYRGSGAGPWAASWP